MYLRLVGHQLRLSVVLSGLAFVAVACGNSGAPTTTPTATVTTSTTALEDLSPTTSVAGAPTTTAPPDERPAEDIAADAEALIGSEPLAAESAFVTAASYGHDPPSSSAGMLDLLSTGYTACLVLDRRNSAEEAFRMVLAIMASSGDTTDVDRSTDEYLALGRAAQDLVSSAVWFLCDDPPKRSALDTFLAALNTDGVELPDGGRYGTFGPPQSDFARFMSDTREEPALGALGDDFLTAAGVLFCEDLDAGQDPLDTFEKMAGFLSETLSDDSLDPETHIDLAIGLGAAAVTSICPVHIATLQSLSNS